MRFAGSLGKRFQSLRVTLLILTVFAAGFALGNYTHPTTAQDGSALSAAEQEMFEPLWQVYNLIQNQYVDPEGDEILTSDLVDGAISGMVEALDDQFSGYMDPGT